MPNSGAAQQRRGRLLWVIFAAVIVLVDQITKVWADASLVYGQPNPVLPVLDITLHYNPGAAFSFLSDAGGWQRWFFTVISAAVSVYLLVWLMKLRRQQWLLSMALTLVLGGALGNLWDRVRLGHVIDFISVHWGNAYFPTFNIADAAISVGAVLLIIDTFIHSDAGDK
ncbi:MULTISPECIES: signal peptidase II [Spongiibacter]|jgi:signal peptidase II|uniref:signal peptidase II n=1 Tax=Spongiibacter TaxID=630749 RepID=UPI000C0A6F31|nr:MULTISPECIES: signal peptidase II [unclassified Spongiibacter]MAK45129.1 signal peptidase II [Spongiibacter sp.]MEE2653369.1 signal peptidase II [Pseudomonadota bacterium]|tara:strand:- start:16808 stop:17314 length:507 start_codon:yes stop_codon:yes gene_type:complete